MNWNKNTCHRLCYTCYLTYSSYSRVLDQDELEQKHLLQAVLHLLLYHFKYSSFSRVLEQDELNRSTCYRLCYTMVLHVLQI